MRKSVKEIIISALIELIGPVLGILSIVFYFAGKTLLIYLFGVFGILFMIAYVLFVLISERGNKLLDYISIGFDFFVSVAVCAFMIASINDNKIQTIILSLSAAIYGGLVTLIGVAWTIKKSEKDKKEEEEKKAAPLFSFNMLYEEPLGPVIKKLCIPENLETEYKDEVYVELENSDRSVVILDGIFHDGAWFKLQANTVMLPNKNCYLSFKYNSPLGIYLITKDTFGKEYAFCIKVVRIKKIDSSGKYFNTVREINSIQLGDISDILNKK